VDLLIIDEAERLVTTDVKLLHDNHARTHLQQLASVSSGTSDTE
jgi:hypothetical protein